VLDRSIALIRVAGFHVTTRHAALTALEKYFRPFCLQQLMALCWRTGCGVSVRLITIYTEKNALTLFFLQELKVQNVKKKKKEEN